MRAKAVHRYLHYAVGSCTTWCAIQMEGVSTGVSKSGALMPVGHPTRKRQKVVQTFWRFVVDTGSDFPQRLFEAEMMLTI